MSRLLNYFFSFFLSTCYVSFFSVILPVIWVYHKKTILFLWMILFDFFNQFSFISLFIFLSFVVLVLFHKQIESRFFFLFPFFSYFFLYFFERKRKHQTAVLCYQFYVAISSPGYKKYLWELECCKPVMDRVLKRTTTSWNSYISNMEVLITFGNVVVFQLLHFSRIHHFMKQENNSFDPFQVTPIRSFS